MDILHHAAAISPNSIAYVSTESTLTFSELNTQVQAVGTTLHETIQESRVGIAINNPLACIVTLLATLRASKTPYLLHTKFLKTQETCIQEYNLNTVLKTCPKPAATPHPSLEIQESNTLCLFTSGSTGKPKCVVHTVSNFIKSAHAVCQATHCTNTSRWLLQLPLFHVSGLSILFRCILVQASIYTETKHSPHLPYTHSSCVDIQLETLIKSPPSHSLTCILVGGSKLSQSLLKKAVTSKLPIYISYGLTETASAIAISKLLEDSHLGACSILPHANVTINNNHIYIDATSLCIGYEEVKTKKCKNIRTPLRTTDIGTILNKKLIINGRSDRIITKYGENISLDHIESLVINHPDISRCSCINMSMKNKQVVCLFIDSSSSIHILKEWIITKIKKELSALCIPTHIFNYPLEKTYKLSQDILVKHAKEQLKDL